MSSLTVSGMFQDLLAKASDVVEIRDSAGTLLGYFTPRSTSDVSLYQRARKLFDVAEMQRRLRDEHGKGSSLEEVMNRL
jgi:hypothetical protein